MIESTVLYGSQTRMLNYRKRSRVEVLDERFLGRALEINAMDRTMNWDI